MPVLTPFPNASRVVNYGEQAVYQGYGPLHAAADTGSYYTATNPTVGTAIALNANVTAFSDTNALFVIKNIDAASNTGYKRIFLDFLRLQLSGTAPTATVSMEFVFKVSYADRFPTTAANLTALTPVQVNGDLPVASICKLASYAAAGAMTIPTSGTQDRTAARARVPTSLGITGDEYAVVFGRQEWPSISGATATRAAAVAKVIGNAAPVVIGPGQSCIVHMWWLTAATTAASFEFELGWFER